MAARPKVTVRPAARTSPTLWSHMRLCALRAALSTSREAGKWVLHSPRAWLGTAFHRLMAARPSDERGAELLWDRAIRELLTAASGHRLDQRFTNPERWPGYYLVRQRAIVSAVRSDLSPRTDARQAKPAQSAAGTEKLLTARNGLLAGRPDQFDQQSVTEYKSALPDPTWPEPDLANKTRRWAIFVHGCFWHSHEGCQLASKPRSNTEYWSEKLVRNRERDTLHQQALRDLGYEVFIVWECETRDEGRLRGAIAAFFARLPSRREAPD